MLLWDDATYQWRDWLLSCIDSVGRKTSSKGMKFSPPYIGEDADYIFDGITGTLPIFGGVPTLNWKRGVKKMIQIDNKFDVGQEVHLVGRKCYTNGKKKRFNGL